MKVRFTSEQIHRLATLTRHTSGPEGEDPTQSVRVRLATASMAVHAVRGPGAAIELTRSELADLHELVMADEIANPGRDDGLGLSWLLAMKRGLTRRGGT